MLELLRKIGRGLLRVPRVLRGALVLLWMAMIWSLSSQSLDGGVPNLWWAWVFNLAHAPLFGLLGMFLVAALLGRGGPERWPRVEGRAGGLVLLVVGLYGVVDECHQLLTPGRDSSVTDVVTDLLGAACVLWIISYLGRAEAGNAGLRWRLAAGVAACAATTFVFSL